MKWTCLQVTPQLFTPVLDEETSGTFSSLSVSDSLKINNIFYCSECMGQKSWTYSHLKYLHVCSAQQRQLPATTCRCSLSSHPWWDFSGLKGCFTSLPLQRRIQVRLLVSLKLFSGQETLWVWITISHFPFLTRGAHRLSVLLFQRSSWTWNLHPEKFTGTLTW